MPPTGTGLAQLSSKKSYTRPWAATPQHKPPVEPLKLRAYRSRT